MAILCYRIRSGRLQPDEHHPRAVRDRRGQFFGSRREPAGRQRLDAGPGRWLFCATVYDLVDYNLMSTIPGLFVIGEANFSDHGANRLGASALMQGLADGYFVLPYTIWSITT